MRMVASDLDGTLVRPDGSVSARTVAALDACVRAGIDVMFVTGRPPRWMNEIAAATRHQGVAVCGNGALVYDLATEQVVSTRPISPASVLAVTAAVRQVLPDAVFALETLAGYRREVAFAPHHDTARMAKAGRVEDLLADDPQVLKVLVRVERHRADHLLGVARVALAGIAEVVHSNPEGSMLEVAAPGVSKASTLAQLTRTRGITPAEVVAFGDMPNDVEMLRWAGRGYAMADGHPEALAAADEIAPPCAEDGVAQVLERLLQTRPDDAGPARAARTFPEAAGAAAAGDGIGDGTGEPLVESVPERPIRGRPDR